MNEKRIAFAAILPLLLVCGVSAQNKLTGYFGEPIAQRVLPTLSQVCVGDRSYFVDSPESELIIFRPEEKLDQWRTYYVTLPARSNIMISTRPGYLSSSQDAQGQRDQYSLPVVDVAKIGLDAWVDRKGHIHTLAVLKQQLEYNIKLLAQWRVDCGTAKCAIRLGRTEEIVLTPVMATGILDRATVITPLRLLQLKLHALRMELTMRCQQETRQACQVDGEMPLLSLEHWRSLLSEGTAAADVYERELAKMEFAAPMPPSAILPNAVSQEDMYSGLPGMDAFFVPRTTTPHAAIIGTTEEYFRKNDRFVLRIDGAAPENQVHESALLSAMTPARLEILKALQRSVEEKIAATRRFADELYPEVSR